MSAAPLIRRIARTDQSIQCWISVGIDRVHFAVVSRILSRGRLLLENLARRSGAEGTRQSGRVVILVASDLLFYHYVVEVIRMHK